MLLVHGTNRNEKCRVRTTVPHGRRRGSGTEEGAQVASVMLVVSTMPTVLFCAFHFTAAEASQNSSYIHILEWRAWNVAAEGLL